MIELLMIISCLFVLYFHIVGCKPIVWEYRPGVYSIRSNGLYLDIDTYKKWGITIWSDSYSRDFKHRCLMSNLSRARSICSEL